MDKVLNGGKLCATTVIKYSVGAEGWGGVGSHVDTPVTVVLGTVGFIVIVSGWYDVYGSTVFNGGGAQ